MHCPECHFEIPSSADRCPHCARPGLYPNVRAVQTDDERAALENVLWAAPLPPALDLPGALKYAASRPRMRGLLTRLGAQQVAIRTVRAAWDTLPEEVLDPSRSAAGVRFLFVRSGVFTSLVAAQEGRASWMELMARWNEHAELRACRVVFQTLIERLGLRPQRDALLEFFARRESTPENDPGLPVSIPRLDLDRALEKAA